MEAQKLPRTFCKNVSMLLPIYRPSFCHHTKTNISSINCSEIFRLQRKITPPSMLNIHNATRYYASGASSCFRDFLSWRPKESISTNYFRTGYYGGVKTQNGRFMSTNSNEGEDKQVRIKRIYLRSPFKWFDIKVKLFLLRSFFDQEFEESEFLEGARQVSYEFLFALKAELHEFFYR